MKVPVRDLPIHEPTGLPIVPLGTFNACGCCPGDNTIISLDTRDRMSMQVGRYLLMRCQKCGKEFLKERRK